MSLDGSSKKFRNKKLLLVCRPKGNAKPSDFRLDDHQLISPSPPQGGLVLQNLFVSIDPAMRGWMSTAKSYLPPVKLGTTMRASTIGRVISSDADTYPVGSVVRCDVGGVQSYVLVSRKELRFVQLLPPPDKANVPMSAYLGVLGITGLTAYFGLLKIGKPKAGDTILISGAAGATGSVVAQLAKIKGCAKVVGTAGTDEKCRWLEENDIVDVAINYKSNPGAKLSRAIRTACPKGVNIVFDNVGSDFLEAALNNLSMGARIVLCGAISQYNAEIGAEGSLKGPRNYMNLLVKRASMKGFVVMDYRKEYEAATRELAKWVADGRLKHAEHVVSGIDKFYPAFMSLFEGSNRGKVLLKVNDYEEYHSSILHLSQRSKL